MTAWIYRVDFTGLDAAGASTSFSYATRGYTAPASHATKPDEWFAARLDQPLLLRRDLYGQGRTYGDVQIAHGTVVLNNSDGGLDGLLAYGFDAQTIEVWKIDQAALGTDLLEFRGVMEQLTLDVATVTILVRDLTYTFDRALQVTKYAGNNVLPNGLEGSSDLQGRPKPIVYGKTVNNMEPVLVNSSRLIYQLHDAAVYPAFPPDNGVFITDMSMVFDRGVLLTYGVSRTLTEMQSGATAFTVSSIDLATDTITFTGAHSLVTGDPVHIASSGTMPASLQTTFYYWARVVSATQITLHQTPADAASGAGKYNMTSAGSGTITVSKNSTPPGNWDGCSDAAGSYFRLGSTPTGRITMTTSNYTTAGYWPEVVAQLVARVGTYSVDNRISGTSYTVGHYWRDETTVYQALRDVMRSVNGSLQLYPNRGGAAPVYLTAQRLASPVAPERLVLDTDNIQPGAVKLVVPADAERGVPAWRINTRWRRNWTVMSQSETDAITLVNFNEVTYRVRQSDTAAVKLKYPAAPELQFDTELLASADADAMGTYLTGLLSNVSRGLYTVDVALSEIDDLLDTTGGLSIPGLLLGDVVKVTYPRFGLDAGKYLAVIGYALDYKEQLVELLLWG